MTDSEQDWADRYVNRSHAWGWPSLFRGLTKTDLLMIDADLLQALEKVTGTLSCRTQVPVVGQYAPEDDVNRILVLSRNAEWQIVRQLRARNPGLSVVSCSYELAPTSVFGKPDLAPKKHAPSTRASRPLVLISTPFSDAEYLCEILRLNRFGMPHEYLDRTLATWIEKSDTFQVARYLAQMERYHGAARGVDLHLQTDVLASLFEHSALNWERLAAWLKQRDAQVVYFSRRDKMLQAELAKMLAPSPYRSVIQIPAGQQKVIKQHADKTIDSGRWLNAMLQQEADLESWLETEVQDFRSVTFEELIEQPKDVMIGLAIYLGKKTPKAFQVPDIREIYKGMPELFERADKARQALTKALGLRLNENGSWETLTDTLLQARP